MSIRSALQPGHPLTDWAALCLALGGSPDSFTGRLLELIQKADPASKQRLRLGFPQHVAALDLWVRRAPDHPGRRAVTGPSHDPARERRMFRHVIPIDDQPHELALTSDPVAVAAPVYASAVVEFWAEHDQAATVTVRLYQVFGTGQPLPPGAMWAGTCPRTAAGLVWHLYEVTP